MARQNEEIMEVETEVFNALAHPLRLKILKRLRGGACCVCKIIPYVSAEQSNVSHHLAILKRAGIVRCQKKGLEVWYDVTDTNIFTIIDKLEEYVISNLKKKSELLKEMVRR